MTAALPVPPVAQSAAPDVWAQGWLTGPARSGSGAVLKGAGYAEDWQHNSLLAEIATLGHDRWTHAECVYLRAGQTLHEAGTVLHWTYFPVTAFVSLSMPDRVGGGLEVATVGREGAVGLPLLDGDHARSRAVVQVAGKAIRQRASVVAEAFSSQPAARRLLLEYAQAQAAEGLLTALCSGRHALEQQVARLILLRLDRQQSQALSMTQEVMAGLLGVRRESVTLAAAKLQQAGVIRCSRGHITVLARHGLEDRACDCHHAIRREFDRLLKPAPAA